MKRFAILGMILLLGAIFFPVTPAMAEIGYEVTSGTTTVQIFEDANEFTLYGEWESLSSGDNTVKFVRVYGTLQRVAFAPVSSASPTASYDITALDKVGIDCTGGEGTDLSATAKKTAVPLIAEIVSGATTHHPYVVGGDFTVDVNAAGNEKQGKWAFTFTRN